MHGTEWEEKWGEKYWCKGRVDKYADKWGREGSHIWHEKWGEQYDGEGVRVLYTLLVVDIVVPCSLHAVTDVKHPSVRA